MTKTQQMPGLFDCEYRMEALKARKLPLERLDGVIPWERFRKRPEAVIKKREFPEAPMTP